MGGFFFGRDHQSCFLLLQKLALKEAQVEKQREEEPILFS